MKALINDYLALWNERDPAVRAAEAVTGHDALNEVIGRAHEKLGDLTFVLGEIIGAHHDRLLFTWHLVPAPGADPVATGYDAAELEAGRIKHVTGFFV